MYPRYCPSDEHSVIGARGIEAVVCVEFFWG